MSEKKAVRIAAVAVATVDGMMTENAARALRLSEIALAESPEIVLLPEAFAAGYCGEDLSACAETLDAEVPQRFRRLSCAGGCMVVFGFLAKAPGRIRNAVAVYDRGELVGVHCKHSLWPDARRPYRDEVSLMLPGDGIEVFPTRLGKMAVLTCYENMLAANWDRIASEADFVVSPYNCQGDPAHNNVKHAKRLALPSAWADRTGTVYAGEKYMPNLGTAGLVDGGGTVIAKSEPGVEAIVVGKLPFGDRERR